MEELLTWTKRNKYLSPVYELIYLKFQDEVFYCVDVKVGNWHYLGSKKAIIWEAYNVAAHECLNKLQKTHKETELQKSPKGWRKLLSLIK